MESIHIEAGTSRRGGRIGDMIAIAIRRYLRCIAFIDIDTSPLAGMPCARAERARQMIVKAGGDAITVDAGGRAGRPLECVTWRTA